MEVNYQLHTPAAEPSANLDIEELKKILTLLGLKIPGEVNSGAHAWYQPGIFLSLEIN
jgi:hypothetical protein